MKETGGVDRMQRNFEPMRNGYSNRQSDRGTLVVNDCRYSTTTLAAAIIASAMIEPSMKQITVRLNDLIRMLDGEVDVTKRRELLRQFRQLLDQADKLNAEASPFGERSNDPRVKCKDRMITG